ncbi:MAG: NAD(P)-dependent oxidoreductase [Streptosporangiaceae bacterium]
MKIAVFGATGPTGQQVCRQAVAQGHQVNAVTRRTGPFPIADPALTPVQASVTTGDGVDEAVSGCQAVLSALGAGYSRHPITVYSSGTRHIVEAMQACAAGRRLVVISAGLAYPPPKGYGWVFDHVVHPVLHNGPGRTLYADMRRMEEYLKTCDAIDWTVIRPGRLVNDPDVAAYQLDPELPAHRRFTSRADLAAAMLAELGPGGHIRQALYLTTR